MTISSEVVELFVPRLFGDAPIAVPTRDLAVCRPENIEETLMPDVPPIDTVLLGKSRKVVNVLLVRAQRGLFPPVRLRARFTAEGFLFHAARERPHDGYDFHCPDADALIEQLTAHGVELTRQPYRWAVARRSA